MPEATPAQSRLVRKRRRVFQAVAVGSILLAPVVSITAIRILAPNTAMAVVGVGGLLWFVGLSIFCVSYWKCPQCGMLFSRGQDGRHCKHCDTHFDLEAAER